MLNIHLYRSTFTNESRIFREVKVIEELDIFDHIHLVGLIMVDYLKRRIFQKNYYIQIIRSLNDKKS